MAAVEAMYVISLITMEQEVHGNAVRDVSSRHEECAGLLQVLFLRIPIVEMRSSAADGFGRAGIETNFIGHHGGCSSQSKEHERATERMLRH